MEIAITMTANLSLGGKKNGVQKSVKLYIHIVLKESLKNMYPIKNVISGKTLSKIKVKKKKTLP